MLQLVQFIVIRLAILWSSHICSIIPLIHLVNKFCNILSELLNSHNLLKNQDNWMLQKRTWSSNIEQFVTRFCLHISNAYNFWTKRHLDNLKKTLCSCWNGDVKTCLNRTNRTSISADIAKMDAIFYIKSMQKWPKSIVYFIRLIKLFNVVRFYWFWSSAGNRWSICLGLRLLLLNNFRQYII